MQKLKLFIIVLIVVIFSLFIGIQAKEHGCGDFNKPFFTTLIFGLSYVALITVYYIAAKTSFVRNGAKDKFTNPLDIWLLSIPMCVLMTISYLILKWYVVEVFFCTMMSLSGMLFANNLGRGSGKWHISKSMPFFIGCIVTIIYGIVIGGML